MASCVCGTGVRCRKCYDKEYSRINKEKKAAASKAWAANNKERTAANQRAWYALNPPKVDKAAKAEYSRVYNNERRRRDPLFKLMGDIRNVVGKSMRKRGYTKSGKTREILGCDFDALQIHLFDSAIRNYGVYLYDEDYQIDHIVPLCSAKNAQELLKLNHYTNLQLLTRVDNRKKGGRVC